MRIMPSKPLLPLCWRAAGAMPRASFPRGPYAPAGPAVKIQDPAIVLFLKRLFQAPRLDAVAAVRGGGGAADPVHALWRARHDRWPVRDAVPARLCAVPWIEGQGRRCRS